MHRRFRLLPLIAVFVTSGVLGDADYASLLQEALAALEYNEMEWAFTEASIEAGTETVARFDPRRPAGERWSLLSVDGREPTQDEIDDFTEDKLDDDESGSDDDDEVHTMVEGDSLTLVEETDEYWLFSFVPSEEDDEEDFAEFMDGTLEIAKDGRYVSSIDIRSDEPFRPRFGVKVNSILTRLTFGPASPDGPIVPQTIDVDIDIRALLLLRIDETVSISFSDYEFVGD